MKTKYVIPFLLLVAVVITIWALRFNSSGTKDVPMEATVHEPAIGSVPDVSPEEDPPEEVVVEPESVPLQVALPLDRALDRVTKKPFGIYVRPGESPVSPERFSGYHNAVDFEIFPEEKDVDVPVFAICKGTLAVKKRATGYGGVLVQRCTLNDDPVTIVYGHVRLASVEADVGTGLEQGDLLGVLGTGYSTETDGERKHLHLGIHKGEAIDIRGYVSLEAALSEWLDVRDFLKSE